ncbi:MAG: DUF4157 domain-containing protein [Actinomycetota bacterium]
MGHVYSDHHDEEGPGHQARAQQPAAAEPLSASIGNRATAGIVEQRRGGLQRAAARTQGAGPLDQQIGAAIEARRGGGQPLADPVRADMEHHLGTDLAPVRIHDDAAADRLSRSVQAEAFTTGTDVFFRSDRYRPTSTDGRRLLAHELTHVVQQSTGSAGDDGQVSHPDDAHEVEARAVGEAVASSAPVDREAAADEDDLDTLGEPAEAVDRQEEQDAPEPELEDEEEPVQV